MGVPTLVGGYLPSRVGGTYPAKGYLPSRVGGTYPGQGVPTLVGGVPTLVGGGTYPGGGGYLPWWGGYLPSQHLVATWRSVCLLRSRRRTFLFIM